MQHTILKKSIWPVLLVVSVSFVFISCLSTPNAAVDTSVPGVIVTRADGISGKIDIYVDGKKTGSLGQGGKWGTMLPNGRHTVSVTYKNMRSRVMDFYIINNRQNFSVNAFENTGPNIRAF
jgi:hypothetical protein